ncbi:MAG: C-GCAxxG-C-C family protein [Proteobacteria bacterium]|nr:C-GCAxxG-C-C family protein [Pseudomonadota bacterium]
MDRIEQSRERALQYHQSGFHCAEAVSLAIMEMYGQGEEPDRARAASAFGAGLGRCKQDVCGGLAGGVLALGLLYGRTRPDQDWGKAARLAAELRNRFVQRYLTTNCGSLLAVFGPQENMMRCKQLSGEVAGILAEILEEENRR